jgi:hypothetical protein
METVSKKEKMLHLKTKTKRNQCFFKNASRMSRSVGQASPLDFQIGSH